MSGWRGGKHGLVMEKRKRGKGHSALMIQSRQSDSLFPKSQTEVPEHGDITGYLLLPSIKFKYIFTPVTSQSYQAGNIQPLTPAMKVGRQPRIRIGEKLGVLWPYPLKETPVKKRSSPWG